MNIDFTPLNQKPSKQDIALYKSRPDYVADRAYKDATIVTTVITIVVLAIALYYFATGQVVYTFFIVPALIIAAPIVFTQYIKQSANMELQKVKLFPFSNRNALNN